MHGNEAARAPVRDDIAEAGARTLRAHRTVRAAVLFGPRAKGDHRPDSDWGIALIVGETATAYTVIEAALSALPGVSPMCVRETAMRICAHRTDSVHAAIATEGDRDRGDRPGAGAGAPANHRRLERGEHGAGRSPENAGKRAMNGVIDSRGGGLPGAEIRSGRRG